MDQHEHEDTEHSDHNDQLTIVKVKKTKINVSYLNEMFFCDFSFCFLKNLDFFTKVRMKFRTCFRVSPNLSSMGQHGRYGQHGAAVKAFHSHTDA
jgi:hypothetical protein